MSYKTISGLQIQYESASNFIMVMPEMKVSKSINDSPKRSGNLKNFDLSVEEIRINRAIKELTQSLEAIERENTQPERLGFFRNEIRKLKDQLEEVRDNTLIR